MKKLEKISEYPFLIFFLFAIIAYFPVLLPFFHLKNDLITQNLPTRYFISESLYSNYFPWWNPYIHFGIPQYGDMNDGFWNPFLWLIAKTFGYNIWTITLEEMLYILVGGWGIYKVLKELGIANGIGIFVALSYMSCGYVLGHLQHFCWITGVGFFPFVSLYFLRVNHAPKLKNFIGGSLSVFLFVSSTHPGLIIGAAYFIIFCCLFIFIFRKTFARNFYQRSFWAINLAFLLLSSIFSIVVIVSDIDLIGHISRGTKVTLAESLLHPTSLQCYLSLLFPLAVNKSSMFATDISMRNVYIGLGPAIALILVLKYINKKILLVTLVPLLFFIFLSSGGVFKIIFYHVMPLLGYVRLNGEFSYFVILIFLLLSAFTLQGFTSDENVQGFAKNYIRWAQLFFLSVMIIALLFILFQHSSIIYQDISIENFKTFIKSILDNFYFFDLLFLNALIQFLTITVLGKKYSPKKSFLVLTGNLVVTTWLILPFTGLGMESKQELNEKMTMLPRGLHAQELKPLSQTKFLDSSLENEFWLLGSYSKKIGYPVEERYPVQLNSTGKFFADTSLHHFINEQAFVFLCEDTVVNSPTNYDPAVIKITEFGPGHLKVAISNFNYRYFIFLQNNYPYWEAWVNGRNQSHFTAYKTFIGLPLLKGNQEILLKFDPIPVKNALRINIIIILLGLLIITIPRLREVEIVKRVT
jgi:hypothetical protein